MPRSPSRPAGGGAGGVSGAPATTAAVAPPATHAARWTNLRRVTGGGVDMRGMAPGRAVGGRRLRHRFPTRRQRVAEVEPVRFARRGVGWQQPEGKFRVVQAV